jgi:hypothetical protein
MPDQLPEGKEETGTEVYTDRYFKAFALSNITLVKDKVKK